MHHRAAFVFATAACCLVASGGQAKTWTATELAIAAKADVPTDPLESKESDPVGRAGVFGVKGSFIVDRGPEEAWATITDAKRYRDIFDGKTAEIIEWHNDGFTMDVTERFLGMESTTRLRSTINENDPAVRTMASVGTEEQDIWTEFTVLDVGNPGFCEIRFRLFADISWMPNFVLKLLMGSVNQIMADAIREAVHRQERWPVDQKAWLMTKKGVAAHLEAVESPREPATP